MNDIPPLPKIRVLVVEDDVAVAATLQRYLERSGMDVACATTGAEALALKRRLRPNVMILDLELPDTHGLTLIEHARHDADCGIVVLTGHADEAERIAGIEVGADDYIAKPPSLRELAARVRAVHRRVQPAMRGAPAPPAPEPPANQAGPAGRPPSFGPVALDLGARAVGGSSGRQAPLTTAEFSLLQQLMEAGCAAVGRDLLCERVLRRPLRAADRGIDQLATRIRRKLIAVSDGAVTVLSERGHGYRLAMRLEPAADAAAERDFEDGPSPAGC